MQDTSLNASTTTESTTSSSSTERRLRGFAAMSPEKKREIASMGGRAAHACGRAHQFSSEEARAAGKKRHQRTSDRPAS
jgi:general stress protein YciG